MDKLNSRELRDISEEDAQILSDNLKRLPIYIVLEDILDTYNIGGFFRLADGIGASKIYLCGKTDVPPNPKITKASIGTYKLVPWEYKKTAAAAIKDLKNIKKMQVLAIEQHKDSIDYRKINYSFPLAFVFGHETSGVTAKTLKLVDHIVEIPMYGINNSLNVMVAAGIAMYYGLEQANNLR